MTIPRLDPLALHPATGARGLVRPLSLFSPASVLQRQRSVVGPVPRRTKIWELSPHLHCSIIGTCLSAGELRQILRKTSLVVDGASDHDLHGHGVLLARQHDGVGKLLQKALDRRHRLAIGQFEPAGTAEAVRALWQDAKRRGDISGAYWATLTHPAATETLVREVFGEIHMLSHLVGSANRADIRRLAALESENAALQERLRRQQDQLREGILWRDSRIRELSAMLAGHIADGADDATVDDEPAVLRGLIRDLERRLTSETRRRLAVEGRLERTVEELRSERGQRAEAERQEAALRQELEAVEASLLPAQAAAGEVTAPAACVQGLSLLYVGGRPNQLTHLRAFSEGLGAEFLQHDGGIEDRTGLLAGLVHRADVVMFPVDCVSHEAVAMVKRFCRQASKPYVPLRSGAISSFMVALERFSITRPSTDTGAVAAD